MRVWLVCVVGLAGIAGARLTRTPAKDAAPASLISTPYAPSPRAAAFVSLGYREAFADLLWVRLTGYFGGDKNTGEGVAGLVEAIVALDPDFRRAYEWGARATTLAHHEVDERAYLRAIAILEQAADRYPDDWRFPALACQIYLQDLPEVDPAQRYVWEERGLLLAEAAVHKHAPQDFAGEIAAVRTKLGQYELAERALNDGITQATDEKVRDRLVKKLAELQHKDKDALRAELAEQRRQFDTAWRTNRPDIPQTMYVVLGGELSPAFDLRDTASQDLIGSEPARDDAPAEP